MAKTHVNKQKQVLIISSTPRKKGNSQVLCEQFLKGAKEAGHKAEIIRLADKRIAYCKGCGACHKMYSCIIKDDMAIIINKMLKADIIVLATPVYFYSMSAQLKTMIDRCASKYTEISGKEFYFIITAADTNKKIMDKVIEALRGFTRDCLEGTKEKGIIYGLGVWQTGEIQKKPAFERAYKLGLKA